MCNIHKMGFLLWLSLNKNEEKSDLQDDNSKHTFKPNKN